MPKRVTIHTQETLLAKTEEVGECVEWQGYHQEGVPLVHHRGLMHSVRRLLWSWAGKRLREGDFITAKCKNRSCVKLEHMRAVDRKTMVKIAGSASNKSAASKGLKISATKRKMSKLTEESVREIRMSKDPAYVECQKHGIWRSTVIAIRANRLWKDTSMFGQLMR